MVTKNPHLDESNRIYEDRIIDMARRADRVSSPKERFIANQVNRRREGLGSFQPPSKFRRVGTAAQTRGPAGMGMNAYVNRPETGGIMYALKKLLRNKQWEQIQKEQRNNNESIWTNLGSKIKNIGGALADEFGGSAMAGELYDWQDVKGQEKFSAEELRNLGLSGSPEGALADENLVSGDIGQELSTIPEGNFMDPLGYKTNYPEDYRTNADILRFDPRYARTEQTIGPVGQGFYPRNAKKPWYQFWNRGGIASLRR